MARNKENENGRPGSVGVCGDWVVQQSGLEVLRIRIIGLLIHGTVSWSTPLRPKGPRGEPIGHGQFPTEDSNP